MKPNNSARGPCNSATYKKKNSKMNSKKEKAISDLSALKEVKKKKGYTINQSIQVKYRENTGVILFTV